MTPRGQYSMIFLGTDTIIETKKADGTYQRNTGFYERGETLNAVYQCLEGSAQESKHIISGPTTLGKECDQRSAEGLLMMCRASCEANSILTAGHSRGAIIMLVTLHRYEAILNFVANEKELTPQKFRDKIIKIASTTYPGNFAVNCIYPVNKDDTLVKFDTYVNNEKGATLEFDAAVLLQALRKKVPHFSAFMIDPVAGQSSGIFSWRKNEFYTLPAFVNPDSSRYIAFSNERTKQFELTFVRSATSKSIPTRVLLSDHGTAMGALDVHGSVVESGKIGKDIDAVKGNRGLKTRHAQKLLASWLVDFFDIQAVSNLELSKKEGERKNVPSIIKTILSYMVKRRNESQRDAFQLKRYEKQIQDAEEFEKLKHTSYSLVLGKYPSVEPRPVYIGATGSAVKMSDVPELHVPPRGYVNHHHIELALKDFEYRADQIGYQLIFNQLSIFINSFENSNGKHKNQANKDCENSDIVKYLCDNSHQGHKMAGYFYLVMERYINEAFASLLSQADADKKEELVKIVTAVMSLLTAIKKYKDDDKNPLLFRKNAKQLRKSIMESWDSVCADFKIRLQVKLDEFSSRLESDEDRAAIKEQLQDFCANDLALAKELKLLSISHHDDLVKQVDFCIRIANEQTYAADNALKAKDEKENLQTALEEVRRQKRDLKTALKEVRREKRDLQNALDKQNQKIREIEELQGSYQSFFDQSDYGIQFQRLIATYHASQDKELRYWLREVNNSIKAAESDESRDGLCRTLLIVNNAMSAPGKLSELHAEANKYLNKQSPQLQRIGYALMGLAVVSVLVTVALCVLTMGVALLPMAVLYGSIFTGAVAVTAGVGSRYAFFAAEQPDIYTALRGLEDCLQQRL